MHAGARRERGGEGRKRGKHRKASVRVRERSKVFKIIFKKRERARETKTPHTDACTHKREEGNTPAEKGFAPGPYINVLFRLLARGREREGSKKRRMNERGRKKAGRVGETRHAHTRTLTQKRKKTNEGNTPAAKGFAPGPYMNVLPRLLARGRA